MKQLIECSNNSSAKRDFVIIVFHNRSIFWKQEHCFAIKLDLLQTSFEFAADWITNLLGGIARDVDEQSICADSSFK